MATSSAPAPVRAVTAEGENAITTTTTTTTPGKTLPRPRPDRGSRPVLGELTANIPRTSSPLKRNANMLDGQDAKGFTYVKRRRLSHNHALTRRITPLSPPTSTSTSRQVLDHDAHSDVDSGRESQNSNHTRGSFSSLINYDPSSQQQQHHTTSRPLSIRSHAEMLRLRLRIALYKVRTNQINVPFARLQLHLRPRMPSHSPDPLPMAPPTRPATDRNPHSQEAPAPPPPPPLLSTPNMYSNRFMPFHAPSSSPPLVHNPLSHIARQAQARMQADRDSLDSEATELADDHDDHMVAESPLDRRHVMLPTGT